MRLQAGSYLHSSELDHRPDALRNHVEVLSSLWGDQGKVRVPRLHKHTHKVFQFSQLDNKFKQKPIGHVHNKPCF